MVRTTERLLVRQWRALRRWLEVERALDHGDAPSGLEEWTVRELVAHLGYGLHMLAEVEPAPPGTEPLDLSAYVGGYAPVRDHIAAATVDLASAIREDVLAGLDELASRSWVVFEDGLPDVVLGRRGPLSREDYLRTRLIELVVHGDDLHRAIGSPSRSPLLPRAVAEVAAALADAYAAQAGRRPPWEGMDLVRAATGRVQVEDPVLPLLS